MPGILVGTPMGLLLFTAKANIVSTEKVTHALR
jgi:hypothetical protein